MRLWGYLLFILLGVALLAGMTTAQEYGGVVTVGITTEPETLDPFYLKPGTWARDLSYALHVYPFLLGVDGHFIPDAARSWEIPDDQTLIFFLRSDVQFHDGSMMTADDFIYTIMANLDQNFQSTWYTDLQGRIEYVEKIDEYTVKVGLVSPYGPILHSFLFPIVPKDSYEVGGRDFSTHPIGGGPFLLKEWEKGEKIILLAHEGFYGGRPYLDQVNFYMMDYHEARLAFFLEELDVLNLKTVDLYGIEENSQLHVINKPGNSWYYLGINQTEGPLSHQKVRQAISYAINRQEIIQEMFYGEMIPATGPIVPLSWAYHPFVRSYNYNPARAVRLLSEAGYPEGFTVELKCSLSAVPYMEMIKEQLHTVGIQVEIVPLNWEDLCRDVQNNHFQLHYRAWTQQGDPERGINRQFMGKSNVNIAGYSNPRVDELAHKALYTLDLETRKEYYLEIQEILALELPAIFLWYGYHRYAYNKRIQDFDVHPFYSYRTYCHMWIQ